MNTFKHCRWCGEVGGYKNKKGRVEWMFPEDKNSDNPSLYHKKCLKEYDNLLKKLEDPVKRKVGRRIN